LRASVNAGLPTTGRPRLFFRPAKGSGGPTFCRIAPLTEPDPRAAVRPVHPGCLQVAVGLVPAHRLPPTWANLLLAACAQKHIIVNWPLRIGESEAGPQAGLFRKALTEAIILSLAGGAPWSLTRGCCPRCSGSHLSGQSPRRIGDVRYLTLRVMLTSVLLSPLWCGLLFGLCFHDGSSLGLHRGCPQVRPTRGSRRRDPPSRSPRVRHCRKNRSCRHRSWLAPGLLLGKTVHNLKAVDAGPSIVHVC